jgi:hypothetical protein
MNGTVTRIRPRGVEATMDSPVDHVTDVNRFQVYRMDGTNEVIIGTFYPKRIKGPNVVNLNPVDGAEFGVAQMGDLIRSI